MKIASQHLLERINSNPSVNEISERLFQLGHENEIVENDIFEIEITPNRGDCLSIDGILRDLSVFYDVQYKCELFNDSIDTFQLNFENKNINACPKVSFLKIKIDGEVKKYHGELKSYYEKLNIKPNNFFADISNYISYETGQPTHCYDYKKIKSGITFEEIDDESSFLDLFNNDIKLIDKNFVFKSNNEIINLAGIIGGKSTSCSEETNEVLIECAYFNPEAIIGKSIKYDINSEAAHKFERGVDIGSHDYVLRRFIQIVSEHSNIVSKEIYSRTYLEVNKQQIKCTKQDVERILGLKISQEKYDYYMEKLGFELEDKSLIVPTHRADIFNKNDIAEEIARCVGYDQIPNKEIKLPNTINTEKTRLEMSIKSFLVDNGFFEVINFPFMPKQSQNAISLDNPLDISKNFMRTNLKESLINNLTYNEKRQQESIRLFEISNLYSAKNDEYSSETMIGIIASGRLGKNYLDFNKEFSEDFFKDLLKKYISIKDLKTEIVSRENLNSQSKYPILYAELKLSKLDDSILDYKNIYKTQKSFVQYEPISEFPMSIRDLSFSIKDFSKQAVLEDHLMKIKSDILKKVYIFDYYKNSKHDVVKIGFRFIFQSNEETITDKQVNKIMDNIIEATLEIESVSIPGLNR